MAERAQRMIRAAEILKELAESDRTKAKMALQQTQGQTAITATIGDPVTYQATLTAYIKQFPDTAAQDDYSKTLKNISLWKPGNRRYSLAKLLP